MKFRKQNKSFADEESFVVKSGGSTLYTSPTLVDNEIFEVEKCFATTSYQFTLELKDEYGDGWTSGAWIEAVGEYGNIFAKIMPLEEDVETHTLSLYYAIKKNQEWKMSTNVSGAWTEVSFQDSTWSSVTLGGTISPVVGTQYFRKSFTGLAEMAAYEVKLNYKCGVVAYINGVEIFRDNMNTGDVSSSTVANGCYSTTDYHGVIRPGPEVATAQSVLAVEIHFTDVTQSNAVDFDSFVAINAPSLYNTKCYMMTDGLSFSTVPILDGSSRLHDFDYQSFVFSSSTNVNIDFTFSKSIPVVNALYIWPYNDLNYAPSAFTFGGKNGGTTYSNVITATSTTHAAGQNTVVTGYFLADVYKEYRMAITSAVSASQLYLFEIHPLVCGESAPSTITFEPSSVTALAGYDIIDVAPTVEEFTNCSIQPTLPNGVTLNQNTCVITGFSQTVSPLTTYTVTASIGTKTFTGTIPMEFVACAGHVIDFYRTYRENANYEYFEVIDDATQQTVYAEAAGSSTINNIHHFVCLTGNQYTANLHSTTTYWKQLSWLYVRGMFLFVAKQSSQNQYENIIRAKFDSDLGLPTSYEFYIQYQIYHSQNWYYKMGELPENWYTKESGVGSWQEKPAAGYPASTNQIQLYKKTFNVNSVAGAAVVLNIRYLYGCVVYLNNHEVFRNGITGTLSTSSFSTNVYTETRYHQVSLPLKTYAVDSNPSVEYITTGQNTIAIAIIAASGTQTASYFDCALRVMGHNIQSRYLNDFSITGSGISGSAVGYFAFWYWGNSYSSSTCGNNYINVQFSYDRREWISSLGIQLVNIQTSDYVRQLTVKARNPGDGNNWTTLKTITGMTWSQPGQLRKIFITNNKPYNEYRFENIGTGDSSSCSWKLARIDMMADAYISVPDLSYEHSTFSIYKDIEMAEEYTNGEYYMDFTVSPALPAGVILDPNSGTISGKCSVETATQTYTISAKKFTGETTSTTVTIAVEICTGGRSLITLVARTDDYPEETSYTLYQGKGTSGTVVSSIDAFEMKSSLNYADFCIDNNIYTLVLKDTYGDGWFNPAGFYLTVDVGTMKFEMGQVTRNVDSVSTMFSSFLPFQMDYDDWKVYSVNSEVSDNWNTVDFDDASWNTMKLKNIGTPEATTVYVRRTFAIPTIEDYHVLNVHIKYTGGIVGYFNGRKVARFNLEEDFTSSTESIAVHDSSKFSQFHVILSMVAPSTTKNVMAFEIHRPLGESSAVGVVFDATGVFGVNDCSIVLDSYSEITGSQPVGTVNLEDFFDLTPVTFGYLPNVVGSYMEWTVENLEGSKFNSYAWQTVYSLTGWGLSLYARMDSEDEYIVAYEGTSQQSVERDRKAWSVPVGAAGFSQFKYMMDTTSTNAMTFSAHFFQFCRPSTTSICEAVGDYPPVAEGEISPGLCEYGYTGYSYRDCVGGVLGEVKNDKCVYKNPRDLTYSAPRYIFVIGAENSSGKPSYKNIITNFHLNDGVSLPDGLTLDATTGEIHGTPSQEMGNRPYTIYGENPKGATSTTVNISIRKGECKADGNFQKTEVGNTASFDCSLMEGSYIGTQTRKCVLGTKDGEWEEISGLCMPTMLIWIIVIIVVVIVIVVIFFISKSSKKNKAVGGVKGKKTTKTMAKKTDAKKAAPKTVKV